MTLSVYILAIGDYSDCIDRALKSVKGADEIVVQAGKDKKTIEIAKKYTDKVFTDYEWNENGGEARNHAISHCTGDWILELDVDNQLVGGIERIKQLIQKAEYEVYSFKLVYGSKYHYFPVLFRNSSKYHYKGEVHEVLIVSSTCKVNIEIQVGTSHLHSRDPKRNIRRLENYLIKYPDAIREKFYLGREYYDNQLYLNAIYVFNLYLKKATWFPEIVEAYYYKALSLWYSGQGQEAREVCTKAIRLNPDCRKALLLMGQMHYEPWKSKWENLAKAATNRDVIFCQ